jgi:hypothetical protein
MKMYEYLAEHGSPEQIKVEFKEILERVAKLEEALTTVKAMLESVCKPNQDIIDFIGGTI